jgi:hypothetical protein
MGKDTLGMLCPIKTEAALTELELITRKTASRTSSLYGKKEFHHDEGQPLFPKVAQHIKENGHAGIVIRA